MWLHGLEHLKVCHHPTKCGGHRQCGSEDIVLLVCHKIPQDQVMKRTSGMMDASPSRQTIILQSLLSMATLVGEL